MELMITINKVIMLLLLSIFITACSGNYKTSDDRYRPIGQPPIAVDSQAK